MIVISFLGCEEEQFEDSDRNPVSIIQSIETGNYNTFKRKPLFTESLNHVTNLITVDSSTIVEMRHNNYLSYTFLVKDDNGLDNRVTNMVVSYIDGNFINKALLDYSFVNQTESGSTDFSPNQLYSFPNGDCGYIVGVYVTPIGTGVDINWQYTLAPCSAGAVDSSNLDPGGVAAVLADLSPSNGGGSNPENSYGLPLHGAYTSYPITPGYSGYVGGYSDYYGSEPFGPTLYNPNNPPSEGGFYDDLINGNKNITTPIFLSASQRFVKNLSLELSQLYDNLTPTQKSSIEDFIEDNSSSYEEYWKAKNFAEEVIEAIANDDFSDMLDLPLFNQDPYDVWGELTQSEQILISLNPFKAYKIYKNRPIATDKTIEKFGYNGRNDKSDAFRHAFFNSMNSRDVGYSLAEMFADAHESEVPNNLQLEVQMDKFNNNIGNQLGQSYNSNDNQLSDIIYQKLLNGDLRYLSPLGPIVPPNFGINSQTQLIPTDQ